MADKKVFALRINEELLKAVERWASDEFRSVNGQLEWIIHKALKDARRTPGPSANDSLEGKNENGRQ